jgi:hypothetical protein
MRIFKRRLSIVLAVIMLLCMPVPALAASDEEFINEAVSPDSYVQEQMAPSLTIPLPLDGKSIDGSEAVTNNVKDPSQAERPASFMQTLASSQVQNSNAPQKIETTLNSVSTTTPSAITFTTSDRYYLYDSEYPAYQGPNLYESTAGEGGTPVEPSYIKKQFYAEISNNLFSEEMPFEWGRYYARLSLSQSPEAGTYKDIEISSMDYAYIYQNEYTPEYYVYSADISDLVGNTASTSNLYISIIEKVTSTESETAVINDTTIYEPVMVQIKYVEDAAFAERPWCFINKDQMYFNMELQIPYYLEEAQQNIKLSLVDSSVMVVATSRDDGWDEIYSGSTWGAMDYRYDNVFENNSY